MRIYLIRHGQTNWNIEGKIQGSHDILLNETGRRQAQQLANGMDAHPVSKIFTSTLKRAVETAEIINRSQKVEIYPMPQLIEVEFGEWEGLTREKIREKYPKEYEYWQLNPAVFTPPGGEDHDQVMNRCIWTIREILKRTNGREDVAVVSHGATIACLISSIMGNHQEETDIIVENASITTVNYNPITEDFMLLEINNTSHITG